MEMKREDFISQYRTKYVQSANSDNLYNEAYKVYENALRNENNFCIFGRLDDIKNILGSIKLDDRSNKYILCVEDKADGSFYITNEAQTGNVLNTTKWTIGVNDAWVLGGIHGKSTFNFVFDQNKLGESMTLEIFIKKYIETDNPNYPTTVTARELLGLICANYTPKIINGMLVLTPPDREREDFDFNKYYTNAENYKGKDLVNVIKQSLSSAFNQPQ